MTHEIGFPDVEKEIKAASKDDFLSLCGDGGTGWISVKDRLPDKSGEYLVYSEFKYCFIVEYSKKHDLFNASDEMTVNEANNMAVGRVTHWMPLPEPPEMYME